MSGTSYTFQPSYYKIDHRKITWTELRGNNDIFSCMLAYPLVKLGVNLGPNDDPAIDSIITSEVPAEQFPHEAMVKLSKIVDDFTDMGFVDPLHHVIIDPVNGATYAWITFHHPDGRAMARASYRKHHGSSRTFAYAVFISQVEDGSFILSSSAKPESLMPETVVALHYPKVEPPELWQLHEDSIAGRRLIGLVTDDEVVQSMEALHVAITRFHVDRGLYHQPRVIPQPGAGEAGKPVPVKDAPADSNVVLQGAVAKMLEPDAKRSWLKNIIVLVLSIGAFILIGGVAWSWEFALMLIPILLLHEAGHWLAMKVFGYRDMRMFFIPLFGAAVTGRQPRVAGWKPVVVYLAGPLPGIALAIVLGIVGIIMGLSWLRLFAGLMLFINGINLLPIMPLDGGRIVNSLLFSRHYIFDLLFRGLGGLALFAAGAAIGEKVMVFFGIAMLVGLPTAWAVSNAVRKLRPTVDEQSFDAAGRPSPDFAYAVASQFHGKDPLKRKGKAGIDYVTTLSRTAMDALTTRPPGVVSTVLLGGTYIGSIAVTLVAGIVMFLASTGNMGGFLNIAMSQAPNTLAPGEVQPVGSPTPLRPLDESVTLVATYENHEDAQATWKTIQPLQTSERRMMLFGATIMVEMPLDDADRAAVSTAMGGGLIDVLEVTPERPLIMRMTGTMHNMDTEVLQEVLLGYSHLPATLDLIAPWDASTPLTEEQLKARRTIYRMTMLEIDSEDAVLQRIMQDTAGMRQQHDAAAVEQFISDRAKRYAELRREAAEKMLAEGGSQVDRATAEMYLTEPTMRMVGRADITDVKERQAAFQKDLAEWQAQYNQWLLQLADRAGRRPQEPASLPEAIALPEATANVDAEVESPPEAAPKATGVENVFAEFEGEVRDPLAIQIGYVEVVPSVFRIESSSPYSPIDGMRAMTRWLFSLDARQVRYEFHQYPVFDESEWLDAIEEEIEKESEAADTEAPTE